MSNIEDDYKLFHLVRRNPIKSCVDLSKNMIGKRNGVFYFTEFFRIDFENKMSDLERLKAEREADKKRIKELEEEMGYIICPICFPEYVYCDEDCEHCKEYIEFKSEMQSKKLKEGD